MSTPQKRDLTITCTEGNEVTKKQQPPIVNTALRPVLSTGIKHLDSLGTLNEVSLDALPYYDLAGKCGTDKICCVCAIGEHEVLQRDIAPELSDGLICLQLLCVCQLDVAVSTAYARTFAEGKLLTAWLVVAVSHNVPP